MPGLRPRLKSWRQAWRSHITPGENLWDLTCQRLKEAKKKTDDYYYIAAIVAVLEHIKKFKKKRP